MSHASPVDTDRLLARQQEIESRVRASPDLALRLRQLRTWQASRLAQTYEDLRKHPRYSPAVEFFLTDLYGPQSFSARDRDFARAWHRLKRTLPAAVVHVLARVIELQVITSELDEAMTVQLRAGRIDNESYTAAYRAVGQPQARRRQLDLILRTGEDLDQIVRHDWIGLALRAAHIPAHLTGFGALQDFLERGFAAFKKMGGAQVLLEAIDARETCIMDSLLAGGENASTATTCPGAGDGRATRPPPGADTPK